MDNNWTKSGPWTLPDFFRSDLCKTGTLIRILNPKTLVEKIALIGNVNEAGGTCDCCSMLDSFDKVIGYKVIYKEEV